MCCGQVYLLCAMCMIMCVVLYTLAQVGPHRLQGREEIHMVSGEGIAAHLPTCGNQPPYVKMVWGVWVHGCV